MLKNATIIFIASIFLLFPSGVTSAQDIPFRVMTYNSLRMSDNDGNRQPAYETVFEEANADIIVMQEVVDVEGAEILLAALNAQSEDYSMAPFINGADTDNVFFYKSEFVEFVSQDVIPTALREISEYIVRIGENEVYIFGAHFRAGDGPFRENERFDEAVILRDRLNSLPSSTEYIVVGDLNISESNEAAYQRLTQEIPEDNGRLLDLVDSSQIGNWRNNPDFALVHSQSPRTTSFNGGATGGMDDRFDFIFSSFTLNNNQGIEYIDGSYTVFGNDGQHFNMAITDGVNLVVSQDVAQALHDASDHLPVFTDFISLDPTPTPPVQADSAIIFSEIFYDTPGVDADEEWIELYNKSDSTVDLSGWFMSDNNGTGYTYVFPEGTTIEAKSYFTAGSDPSAFYALYSYDADIYGRIPRLNNSGDVLLLVNPDSIIIDQVGWEGGASSGLPEGWASDVQPKARRGESIVRLDLTSDSDTYLDWSIVPNNGDPQTQPLFITNFGIQRVSNESEFPASGFALNKNYPNPVSARTTISFTLEEAAYTRLMVYDILGREVSVIVDSYQPAGIHDVSVDASFLPEGLYLYRLTSGRFTASNQFIVAR